MEINKRIKVLGKWAADRGYDSWNIFIGNKLWTQLIAATKNPISIMIKDHPTADIDWNKVRAVKLT